MDRAKVRNIYKWHEIASTVLIFIYKITMTIDEDTSPIKWQQDYGKPTLG